MDSWLSGSRRIDMVDNLFNETGHASIDDRNTEAIRLIDELKDHTGEMQSNERQFVTDMFDRKEHNELRCSGKQLYWLRDLYEKYCL
jgi:hypothetical protein